MHSLKDSSYEGHAILDCKIKSEEEKFICYLKGKVSFNLLEDDKQGTKSELSFFLDQCMVSFESYAVLIPKLHLQVSKLSMV